MDLDKCPICGRIMLEGSSDRHHFVPKTFGGKETEFLHRICHRKIHSVFTERELLHEYHTVDAIMANDEMQKFVRWVKKKEPEFYDGSKDTNDRKGKRRR